jgi:curli production assembly/transport component CsgG
MISLRRFGFLTACLALGVGQGIAAPHPGAVTKVQAPAADQSTPAKRVVAIYEFRSSVTEIPARGATDMFIDALVRSGQFQVVERSQLNQSLLLEKQLASQGLTAPQENPTMRAARYLFEGTISEANASEAQSSGSFDIGGMSIGGGKNKDVIAVDVRVVDAHSGDVLATVTVRKPVKSTSANVSGVGNLIGNMMAQGGKDTTYTPNANAQVQHKESLDSTLRELINDAVAQLAARF